MNLVLLVEDNPDIMRINCSALSMRGYDVLEADCIERALSLLTMHSPDVIVLDIMLPDGNGIDFCRELKGKRNIPILFLSALGENENIVAGLRAGGDDYLAKPYDLDVLIARIEARLRNSVNDGNLTAFGDLILNVFSHTATCKGTNLLLTQKEFAVLHLLATSSRKGRGISKEDLYSGVWGQPIGNDSNALWTVISRLKTKLYEQQSGLAITFSKHEGYILETE